VEVAGDGDQALEMVKLNPENFNLIVTDLSMPNRSGAELTRAIRALGFEIPIILSTGQLGIEDMKELVFLDSFGSHGQSQSY